MSIQVLENSAIFGCNESLPYFVQTLTVAIFDQVTQLGKRYLQVLAFFIFKICSYILSEMLFENFVISKVGALSY